MISFAVAVAMGLAMPSQARAQTLSLGNAAEYAVFEVSGSNGQFSMAGGSVNGYVALGQHTTFTMTGGSIQGTAYADSPVTITHTGGSISGGIASGTSLSAAGTSASTAASAAAGLTTTANLSINMTGGSQSFTGTQALNVINVAQGITMTGGTFTINGTANQWFVFNVSNGMTLTGGNGIRLGTGGVTASHILFNVSGTTNITGPSDAVNGTILDLRGAINMTNGTVNGALISENNITITGADPINADGFVAVVPEMPTIAMAACGCLMLLAKSGWDRMRRKQSTAR
jgi:choice-of-anchor A domain-containing protein